MPLLTMTRDLAYRASSDAANRAMRTGGRKAWSEGDAEVARLEFLRLWPLCPHLIEPEDLCVFCDQDIIPAGHALSTK